MKPDEASLVRRCLEGKTDGFDELLERYEKPVFNVALRMVGNPDDARDVTQSVFLKAFRHGKRRIARKGPDFKNQFGPLYLDHEF